MGFIQDKVFEAVVNGVEKGVEKGVKKAVSKAASSAASYATDKIEDHRNKTRNEAFNALLDKSEMPFYFTIRGRYGEFSVLEQGTRQLYTAEIKSVPNSTLAEITILNKKKNIIASIRQLNKGAMQLFYNKQHIGNVVRTINYNNSSRELHVFNGWLINSSTIKKNIIYTVSNNTVPLLKITHTTKLHEHMYLTEFLGNCDGNFAIILSFCVLLDGYYLQ